MRNQISHVLPRAAWQDIVIEENNEPLVEVQESDRLKLGLKIVPGIVIDSNIAANSNIDSALNNGSVAALGQHPYQPLFIVRKTVAEKLMRISQALPDGLSLVLIEGYRTMKSQQDSWDRKFAKIKDEHPDWNDEKIEQQVRLVLAKPAPLANHHCGGAVDVTLVGVDGRLLDMGTPYPGEAMSADWHDKFKMFSDSITDVQAKNRTILREAMESEDMVWYPGEWWHYCWNDRMWAVYSGQSEKKSCGYGSVEL